MKNETPAPFEESNPFAQLLIFIGVFCISFFVLGVLSALMQQSGAINLASLEDATRYKDYSVVQQFRIFQLISDIFLFIVPVIVISLVVSRHRLQYLQMNSGGGFIVLLLGMVTIIASTPVINYISELNSQLHLPDMLKRWEDTGDAIEVALMAHHTINDLLLNLFVMALAAAVCEEFFFRAGMQTIVIKMSKNKHVGIWVTAIIFSAIHMQFSGFFPRMLLGGFLGYLYVWSGSIWVGILAHFIFNASQIVFSYLQDAKATSGLFDKVFSDTPSLGYIIASTVLVTLLVAVIYKLSKKKPTEDIEIDIISE